jgi:hypothetical protein
MAGVGLRGPTGVDKRTLRLFANLYYQDFLALAEGRIHKGLNYEQLHDDFDRLKGLRLSTDDLEKACGKADREIQEGRVGADKREMIANDFTYIHYMSVDATLRAQAVENARVDTQLPEMCGVLQRLEGAKTPEDVGAICKEAFRIDRQEVRAGELKEISIAVWPIEPDSQFPIYLSIHAQQFLEAKNKPKFPKSDRPSSRRKRIWFYACALAAAVQGLKTRTAINLLGQNPPEQEPIIDIAF